MYISSILAFMALAEKNFYFCMCVMYMLFIILRGAKY